MKMLLNCDLGESFGIWSMGMDKEIMPLIDMANLACGFHASDPYTMNNSVINAKKYKLSIGAHPGYADLLGFGRKSIPHTSSEIQALIVYQIGALSAICKANKTKISYVKPHGALYNDMMKDIDIFTSIVKAISSYDDKLKLMILSNANNNKYIKIAKKYNVKLLFEVFADRNYNDDGSLVARVNKNAVLHDKKDLIKRISDIKNKKCIYSINDKKLSFTIDTICVHGDNKQAVKFVKLINKNLAL